MLDAMRKRIASFAPVVNSTAKVLILGSMPGKASLDAGQYYAHPRNAFWRIMGELIGFEPSDPYEKRLEALKAADIALWDVLHSCHREGSLDVAIETDSIEVNNFMAFFDKHPDIRVVCFNGAVAERYYQRYVLLKPDFISYIRLPSTSPAHAALSFEQKISAWREAIFNNLNN
jgi:double-stranded uracil-DNA glycosylase